MSKSGNFRGKRINLPIASILLRPELQSRDEESAEHTEDLRETLKRRKSLPPVKIVNTEEDDTAPAKGHCAIDGFHTVRAHIAEGRKTVPCIIQYGTWEQAIVASAGANADPRGLRRTTADKRRAVVMMLANLGSEWTNGRIAEHVGVSDEMVRTLRPTVQPVRQPASQPQADATRTGADGKHYPTTRKPASGKPASKAADWEGVGLNEVLKGVKPHVWEALAEAKIKTAGELLRKLTGHSKDAPKVSRADAQMLLKQAEEFKAKNNPPPEFDWKGFISDFGPIARGLDRMKESYPEFAKTTQYNGLKRLANELLANVEKAQKQAKS